VIVDRFLGSVVLGFGVGYMECVVRALGAWHPSRDLGGGAGPGSTALTIKVAIATLGDIVQCRSRSSHQPSQQIHQIPSQVQAKMFAVSAKGYKDSS